MTLSKPRAIIKLAPAEDGDMPRCRDLRRSARPRRGCRNFAEPEQQNGT